MKQALQKSWQNIKMMIPILLGILMLVNLLSPMFSRLFSYLFTENVILDPMLGAIGGSAAFGIPITSYILGGEFLKQGVSLIAITAFMLAWSTVGIFMLPLEIKFLGKKFAIKRNIINFFFAIIISILTVFTLNLFT